MDFTINLCKIEHSCYNNAICCVKLNTCKLNKVLRSSSLSVHALIKLISLAMSINALNKLIS